MFCVAMPQKSASPCSILFQFSHNASNHRWEPSGAHVIGGCVTSIVCNRITNEFIPVLDHSRPVPLNSVARPITSPNVEFGDSLPVKSAFEAIYGGVVAAPGDSAVEGSGMDTVTNGFSRGECFSLVFSESSWFSPYFLAAVCIDAPTHLLPPPSKLLGKVCASIAAAQNPAARLCILPGSEFSCAAAIAQSVGS
jgi:hypothetical protein